MAWFAEKVCGHCSVRRSTFLEIEFTLICSKLACKGIGDYVELSPEILAEIDLH